MKGIMDLFGMDASELSASADGVADFTPLESLL
jgi:hypothetical protein